MEKADITIIGAGVIGLAVSYLLSRYGKETVVVERNASFGQETSSRNSEVIHAGLYYPKNSLKSRTCLRGKELLYDLCATHDIPCKKTGKLVVAFDAEGVSKLNDIYQNAKACGVDTLRFLEKPEVKSMEPDIEATSAFFSPDTGIVDTHRLMKFFFDNAKQSGAEFAFSVEVTGIRKKDASYEIAVREPQGGTFTFETGALVNCAGLRADTVAALAGIDPDANRYRINYCKGQYFRIRDPGKFRITHPVYPPPTDGDLGIHITPDMTGGLRLGPDARYVQTVEYTIDEEEGRRAFRQSVARFLPRLTEDDLIPDTAGVRPKLQGEHDGFRDFVITDETDKGFPDFINCIGIDSPGLTSCLAIAERVVSCLNIR
jgi:L-2-hydroxyglutarate oxidase LhgO